MTARWFFSRVGDVIEMRARFEADDGTIGDAFQEVRRGEKAYGLTYQELFAAGAGVLVIEDGKAQIVTP
jgi:hypothetical protein